MTIKKNLKYYVEKLHPYFIYLLIIIPSIIAVINLLSTSKTTSKKIFSFDGTAYYFYISLLFISIFRFLEKKIKFEKELFPINSFNPDITKYLGDDKKYKNITIFAHSGDYYVSWLKQTNCNLENVHIFLRAPKGESILFPKDKKNHANHFNNSINSCKELNSKHKIRNLEIYQYTFDSYNFFMLADDKILHFGLLNPNSNLISGSEPLDSQIVFNSSLEGYTMIANHKKLIKSLVEENHAEKIYP